MNVLDLFSGIGGFSLGLERADMRTVAFCETEPFCQRVLAKHWPGVPIYPDVRELTKEQLDADGIAVDLICGGYPCQPFSHAGQRRGEEDDRHLWPEMHRLVAAIRPRWMLGENVAGHIMVGLDQVLSDLEALDYTARPFVIPACAVDAPHRRDRVWIVAHTANDRPGRRQQQQEGSQGARDVAHANSSGLQKRGAFGRSDGAATKGIIEGRSDIGSHQKDDASNAQCGVGSLGGAPRRIRGQWQPVSGNGDWAGETKPCLDRKDDGISGRLDRLRALGNAVVPQVVETIGHAIMTAHQHREAG